jgi:hypothetical protein
VAGDDALCHDPEYHPLGGYLCHCPYCTGSGRGRHSATVFMGMLVKLGTIEMRENEGIYMNSWTKDHAKYSISPNFNGLENVHFFGN